MSRVSLLTCFCISLFFSTTSTNSYAGFHLDLKLSVGDIDKTHSSVNEKNGFGAGPSFGWNFLISDNFELLMAFGSLSSISEKANFGGGTFDVIGYYQIKPKLSLGLGVSQYIHPTFEENGVETDAYNDAFPRVLACRYKYSDWIFLEGRALSAKFDSDNGYQENMTTLIFVTGFNFD